MTMIDCMYLHHLHDFPTRMYSEKHLRIILEYQIPLIQDPREAVEIKVYNSYNARQLNIKSI